MPPILRRTAYCYGVQHGGDAQWREFVRAKVQIEVEQTEREKLLRALTCTENVDEINEFISLINWLINYRR